MPDRQKFTLPSRPSEFESRSPFRETFLRHFSAEDAAGFRHLGTLTYEAFMEGDVLLPRDFAESHTWREMDAALQDLRFIQHYLAEVAESLEVSCLDPDDAKLALAAADFSVELGKLADRMEGVMA